MIFHSGILALLIGSVLVTVMTLYAGLLGTVVLLRWDFQSSSAYQLSLERKTYLISTIMNYVLGFQILSVFLFVYTAEDIHQLFVGAMCATGSLNANPVGWLALLSKIIICFAAGLWLVLNYLDHLGEDFPLVRLKYAVLLVLLPCICADLYLQLQYFLGLDPDIITSCCGSLFSTSGGSVASSIAGLPAGPSMVVFYTGFVLYAVTSLFGLFWEKAFLRYLHSSLAALFFIISMASVVSFISMYVYELPTHHCPFDMIQKEYSFIGYPLYATLFCGVFFGLLPGIFQRAGSIPSLQRNFRKIERTWLLFSLGCMTSFVMLTTYMVLFSNLTYFSVLKVLAGNTANERIIPCLLQH
ncbi:MAG TPA: hypothetical protein DDY20_13620 [Desulfobulbaceae bacterium]|nr:hypothetical protein [Desulfobulbaceae bacterium]